MLIITKNIKVVIICLLICTQISLFAQIDTTRVDSSLVQYNYFYSDFPQQFDYIDTNIYNFQRNDAAYSEIDFPRTFGNIGMPHKSLIFNSEMGNSFNIGEDNIRAYYLSKKDIKFYKPYIPYSEAAYANGSEEQNYFDFTLSNQISKTVYLGVDVGLQTGLGTFKNQRVKDNQFQILGKYNTLNNKYHTSFNFIRNRLKFGENGGIVLDSNIDELNSLDRRILQINLSDAYTELSSNEFQFNQKLYLAKMDSGELIKSQAYIFLNLNYNSKSRLFFDGGTDNYYTNYVYNIGETYDSINAVIKAAEFGFSNMNTPKQIFAFKFSGNYKDVNYFYNFSNYKFSYFEPKALLSLKVKGHRIRAKALYRIFMATNYGFNYGANDFCLKSDYLMKLNKNLALKLNFRFDVYDSEFANYKTFTNHFNWQNNFKKTNNLELGGNLNLYGFNFNLRVLNTDNYVFLNENIAAQQATEAAQYIGAKISKDLMWKRLGLYFDLSYQKASKDYIRVPDFTGRLSLFTEFYLFKKKLMVVPGIDLYAISSYYANAYDPNLMRFYIQNESKLDNILFYDAYINLKIKQARVFIKYVNLSSNFGDFNYFLIPSHPVEDPGIRFGLSWRFQN